MFILSLEILADAIRQKKEICGITLNGKAIKLSQYPDDTTIILDGSENSFLGALKMKELFGKISGVKLKNSKTEALWTGANAESNLKLRPEKNFKWPQKKNQSLRSVALNRPRFDCVFKLQR